jgi:DNA invertase Pin-like site-specific DNA recombinase
MTGRALEATPGSLVGYARVSTRDQHLERHIEALAAAGCARIFQEKASGKSTADRPELAACLDYLRPGDTLVVPALDRLGRNLKDLIEIIAELNQRGVKFWTIAEGIDTSTPQGEFMMHVFAALAEFIRKLIVQGTRAGLDSARERGVRLGRPPAMTREQIQSASVLVGVQSVASIARMLGVSRGTLYNHVPELRQQTTAASS